VSLLPSGTPQVAIDRVAEAVTRCLRAAVVTDAQGDPVISAGDPLTLARIAKGGITWRHFPEFDPAGVHPRCVVSTILYRTEGRFSLVERGKVALGIYWTFEPLANAEIQYGEPSIGAVNWHTINAINNAIREDGGLKIDGVNTVRGYPSYEFRAGFVQPLRGQAGDAQVYMCGVEPTFSVATTLTGFKP
jgi:hypothetical protein